ncbi:electron transfer flavoprotein-ubiquinone oxidoreductase [Siccirubricoccus sp. KC 17139]|uniref:Electron transfer flavoprotein-ubiquinone oxidoreductase n=1 Tax=Siccirubricoccus soli TaxID=2899147 RepID=A0ABT1DD25_9PROT|nr:electron transfer flavoprotein-ubiquinone oxidoreductase [Siccirubricoccus soli]MCO6419838.1 electron transfer flavoprotein-ubiquinone oxidoreductase [Siccirubricoccus soli]MCP2685973.1 electron transfer flavoprotein-ubiquinone oxidoreductase [Siccirubricoccus soli]
MSGAEEREAMEFDVLIVGGGPAGLAAAIRLKQLAPDTAVCLVEKGSEIGAHILSGAVLEPRALDELIPDWRDDPPALATPARDDRFMLLTETRAFKLPTPPQMHNEGNYIVSLGNVCRWLGAKAEALGVEIYPGFAASETIIEDGQVRGVVAGVMGIQKDGEKGPNYQPGMELRATYTLFAEGCRGSLTKKLQERYNLREGVAPQTYALGMKELWEIPKERHQPGLVWHSTGWPLASDTYGGSWLYMLGENLVSIGFVVGLDYPNPWLSPFDEFQRFKTHPEVRKMLEGGKRIAYGARALNEGGFQAIPKLVFPGGMLIGDCAGFLNVPKIKGTHTSMKSGMVAAEAVVQALAGEERPPVLESYPTALKASWVWTELQGVRNIRPGFEKFGFWGGMVNAALDTYLFRGKAPWTWTHHQDHETLKKASEAKRITYPKPDGVLTFDRLSSVFLSNTNHEEDQPAHLKLKDPGRWKGVNWDQFRSPESRYCPAAVYEAVGAEAERELKGTPDAEATGEGASVEAGDAGARLVINAQNCVHCKTCDIKDPTQNIDWTTPEGGGGPNYIGGM